MPTVQNVNKFLEKKNLSLFQLFVLLSVKNKQKLDTYFPVNHLDLIYYAVVYTTKGEDAALRTHKQIILASHWLKEIHKQIRENKVDISALLMHDAKKHLDQELPTTFIKATQQRMLSEYIPLRQQFIRQYKYKVENGIPFTNEDMYFYIQLSATKAFLY